VFTVYCVVQLHTFLPGVVKPLKALRTVFFFLTHLEVQQDGDRASE
jgi:hypothetical protein